MATKTSQAPLSFMAIWLTGWSLGVAVIQSMVVSGELSVLLFLFTHGGAEVLVLVLMAKQLRDGASTGSSVPRLDLEHDGLVATWTAGTASRLRGIGAAALGLVAHTILMLGLASGLSDGATSVGWALAAVCTAVWCVTAVIWTRGVLAQLRGVDEVTLKADLDGVDVTTRAGTRHFALAEVTVASSPDELTVEGGGERLRLPCVDSNEKREIVEMLALMAGREDDRLPVPVPESLASMREPAPQ